MTTRYRVEYALKTHRRDQFIEWIKGLLAVPFVLASKPAAVYDDGGKDKNLVKMANSAHQRYADIFRDIEALILDHIKHQESLNPRSKLAMLVPTISKFFTPLALVAAFEHQDALRSISSRRFVPPSFNDIRLILTTSQIITLMQPTNKPGLQLLTFDGDVTLYEDGGSLLLLPDGNLPPIISHLLYFLAHDVRIGIVTAAGYSEHEGHKYYDRLSGLIDTVAASTTLTNTQKEGLIIMGGESNFLFVFDQDADHYLRYVHRRNWILPQMVGWAEPAIQSLLSAAEAAFRDCVDTLHLSASVLRKERAVGIYNDPSKPVSSKLTREQLEETVLVVQQILEAYSEDLNDSPVIPWTAFNGGSDVFVDIGDKSLGVQACQKWFGGIQPANTLHVGDQFLSGGGNDFKARDACCTAWIASPVETATLLETMIGLSERKGG